MKTYEKADGSGDAPDLRLRDRSKQDPRIQLLMDGFESRILTAEAREEHYDKGYLWSMRESFRELLGDLLPVGYEDPRYTIDQIAQACVEAEISDGRFESLSIALGRTL